MKLHELSPAPGSAKERYRKGRGVGSGNGKTAGKGHKGQNSRSGGGVRPGFEGGQLPLYRRLPKRGFKNFVFKKEYAVVNLRMLEDRFNDGDVVTADKLLEARIIKNKLDGVKILAAGNLTKKLTVKADLFSENAKNKIESIGGKAEVV
jgi:large subunit ribosomal protein L15